MIDADLSRLYTATSLMQIDDNIMRFVLYFRLLQLFCFLVTVLLVPFVCAENLKYVNVHVIFIRRLRFKD